MSVPAFEASMRLRPRARRPARWPLILWLPTTPIFLALAPLALAVTPLLYLAPRQVLPDPLSLVLGVGRLLLCTSGTVIEVSTFDTDLRIRLF